MAGVLVVAEQRQGKLNRASWETIVGAQQLGGDITVLVPGTQTGAVANELAAAQVKEIVTLEHAALEPYTPDGFTTALQDAIGQLAPDSCCCRTPTRRATLHPSLRRASIARSSPT